MKRDLAATPNDAAIARCESTKRELYANRSVSPARARVNVVRMVRLLFPAALFFALAVAVASYIASWLRLDPSPLLPHLSLVLSFVALQYVMSAILATSPISARLRKWLIWIVTLPVSAGLLTYYLVLAFSLTFLKDIPTYSLIFSYFSEVPTLLASLPLTRATLFVLTLTVLIGWAALSALSCWCLAYNALEFSDAPRTPRRQLAIRMVGYGCLSYLFVSFSVPLFWHFDSHEPLTATWYNERLTKNNQHYQRNLVESARDSEIAERYQKLGATSRPNVILIYVDALRADVTQPYGDARENMPFVTNLVQLGTLRQIEFGIAGCPATFCGLGAILQSRPTWLQSPDNFSLPKLLSGQGYKTAYVLSSNHQGYFELKKYYEPTDFYRDSQELRRGTDDYQVLDGLAQLGAWDGRPTFLMIGLVSPHALAYKRDEHRQSLPDRLSLADGPEQFKRAYRNNYDNGVRQADDVINRTWLWLSANRYLNEDSIVVITSDHGESLGEGGVFGHINNLSNAELRIPLWIRYPGGELRNVTLARQLDIAPTVVAGLGLPSPRSWRGRSLTEPEPLEWSDHYLQDKPNQIAVIHYSEKTALKYLFDGTSLKEAVFDVFEDPHETKNVIGNVSPQRLELIRVRAAAALRDK